MRRRGFSAGILLLLMLGAGPARADLVLSLVVPGPVAPNSSGFFEVTLTNAGLTPEQLGSYDVTLFVPLASGLTFGAVDKMTTDPILFPDGPPLNPMLVFNTFDLPPDRFLNFNDEPSGPVLSVTLAPGQVAGLGRVAFSTGPGFFDTFIDFDVATTLLDQPAFAGGNPLSFSSEGATLESTAGAAVPEPAPLVGIALGALLLIGFAAGCGRSRARRGGEQAEAESE